MTGSAAAEVERRVLHATVFASRNLRVRERSENDHVVHREIGLCVDLEDLVVHLVLPVAREVPVGVIGHVDYRRLIGRSCQLNTELVRIHQEERRLNLQ